MSTRPRISRFRDDSGVSLVIALLFIAVVGIFADAALTKAANVAASGAKVKSRAQLQYALDGGVERGLQDLVDDLKTGAPAKCTAPGSASGSGSLSLNGQTVSYTCNTLAGRAANTGDGSTTNFAVVTTSPSPGGLKTKNAVSSDVQVGGSVYLAGAVTNSDLSKPLTLSVGDLVSPSSRPTCASDLAALTNVTLATGSVRLCTEQTVAQAEGAVSLPTAPAIDLSGALGAGVPITKSGKKCQVFYPGLYTSPPALSTKDANYFVSGTYYFRSIGTWTIDKGSEVTGGQRSAATDVAVPTNGCSAMADSVALADPAVVALLPTITGATLPYGNTWVFGGVSTLDFKNGTVTLFSPPLGANTVPLNLVGATAATPGYLAVPTGTAVVTGGTNNSTMQLNAKLWAPTGTVSIFSTNDTVAAVKGGIVAYTVNLQASNSGSGGILVSAAGGISNPPPPFRTVKIVTADSSGGSSATNTTIATISNFNPYTVKVYSWRTG